MSTPRREGTRDDAPSRVCVTTALLSLRSSAQVSSSASANQFMFAVHWSKSMLVLQVPQTRALSAVRFCWACLWNGTRVRTSSQRENVVSYGLGSRDRLGTQSEYEAVSFDGSPPLVVSSLYWT